MLREVVHIIFVEVIITLRQPLELPRVLLEVSLRSPTLPVLPRILAADHREQIVSLLLLS